MRWRGPFFQEEFKHLPEKPGTPHGFYKSKGFDLQMHSAHFGRLPIHYRKMGKGPPLLLIHGLMTSSYSFRYVLEPLSAHFTVYAPDLPGAGRSGKPLDCSYEAAALAAWIGEFMDALGIRGCDVIGNSLGGHLCMILAMRDPKAIGRLVNLHSPAGPDLRLFALSGLLWLPGMMPLLSSVIAHGPRRWAHEKVHYYDERLKSLEEAAEYGDAIASHVGSMALCKYLYEALDPYAMADVMRRIEQYEEYNSAFPVPLQLIYARRDPIVSPKAGQRLKDAIPAAELVWLEEASHFAQVDAPDRLLAAVLPFLGIGEAAAA